MLFAKSKLGRTTELRVPVSVLSCLRRKEDQFVTVC